LENFESYIPEFALTIIVVLFAEYLIILRSWFVKRARPVTPAQVAAVRAKGQ
jgi:hypothetical protein